MAKGIWRRVGDVAVPVGDKSREYFFALKDGTEFIAETKGARNLEHLKKFWVLVDIVSDAIDVADDVIKKDVAISLGFTKSWVDHNGRVRVEAASIAVESMTQEVFSQFFDRAVNEMASWIGCDQKELMQRYNEAAADKRYEGMRRG